MFYFKNADVSKKTKQLFNKKQILKILLYITFSNKIKFIIV